MIKKVNRYYKKYKLFFNILVNLLGNIQPKIVTVIQARMGSSRLPHKVMMSLAGKPLLIRMVERVTASKLTGTVVVATTTEKIDDVIYQLCKRENINVFRGHPTDLLDRHYSAGKEYNADIVVKIPSDCPLIDPSVITNVLQYYIDNQNQYDYVSNLHPPTFPDGNDVEVMSMQSLAAAKGNAVRPLEREHTTPFFWENPEIFRIGNVSWELGFDYSKTHRWTIDYEEDYCFIKNIYDELYDVNPNFSMYDILTLLDKKPFLMDINKKFAGLSWYNNHMSELRSINYY